MKKPSKMDQKLFSAIATAFVGEEDRIKRVVGALVEEEVFTVDQAKDQPDTFYREFAGLKTGSIHTLRKALGESGVTAAPATAQPTPATAPQGQQTIRVEFPVAPAQMRLSDLVKLFAGGERDPEVVDAVRARVPFVLVKKDKVTEVDAEATSTWLGTHAARSAQPGQIIRGQYVVKSVDAIVEPRIELDPIDGSELDAGHNNDKQMDWNEYDRSIRAFLFYLFRSNEFPRNALPTTNAFVVLDALDSVGKSLDALAKKRGWSNAVDRWNVARQEDEGLEARMIEAVYPPRATRRSGNPGGLEDRRGHPFGGSGNGGNAAPDDVVLLDRLNKLNSPQFGEVVLRLGVPTHLLPGPTAAPSEHAISLIRYMQQRGRLADLKAQVDRILPTAPAPSTRQPQIWTRERHIALREVMAGLYSDPNSAKMFAADVGLDVARITFSGRAMDLWDSILEEAKNQGMIDSVIALAKEKYSVALARAGF